MPGYRGEQGLTVGAPGEHIHGRRDKLPLSFTWVTVTSPAGLSACLWPSRGQCHCLNSTNAGAMEALGREGGSGVWAQLAGGRSHCPEHLSSPPSGPRPGLSQTSSSAPLSGNQGTCCGWVCLFFFFQRKLHPPGVRPCSSNTSTQKCWKPKFINTQPGEEETSSTGR